jgi:hypothetical protein
VGVLDRAGLRALPGIPEHLTPVGVVLIGHGVPDTRSPSPARGHPPLGQVLQRERW